MSWTVEEAAIPHGCGRRAPALARTEAQRSDFLLQLDTPRVPGRILRRGDFRVGWDHLVQSQGLKRCNDSSHTTSR